MVDVHGQAEVASGPGPLPGTLLGANDDSTELWPSMMLYLIKHFQARAVDVPTRPMFIIEPCHRRLLQHTRFLQRYRDMYAWCIGTGVYYLSITVVTRETSNPSADHRHNIPFLHDTPDTIFSLLSSSAAVQLISPKIHMAPSCAKLARSRLDGPSCAAVPPCQSCLPPTARKVLDSASRNPERPHTAVRLLTI